MRRMRESCLTLGLLLAGCPSDDTPAEQDAGSQDAGTGALDAQAASDAQAGSDAQAADPKAKVGTFTVRLVEPAPASGGGAATSGHTTLIGRVFDGPQPEEIVWEVDTDEGDCRLIKPRVPFCDPACEDAVCVEDDQCQKSPTERSAGTLTLSGVRTAAGATSFEVKPIGTSYSTPGGVSLPNPPFEEGDEVRLKAAGQDVPAFEITARGIAPLELTTTAFPLRSDAALALAWKKPEKPELGSIEIEIDISHHGGTKGKILCDSADTGALTISANLAAKLLKLGVAGFPTMHVARVNRGSAQISAGSVELQVISELERAIDIEGLASCSDTSECPSGKTCQDDLTCK